MAQDYTVFTADGRSATVQAESASEVRDSFRRQFPDLYDQGVIIRDLSTGRDSYVSSGYATSDPERIAEIAEEGYSPGEASRQGIYEQTLRERPVAARVVSAARAVPFVGEGIDEATGHFARLTGGEGAEVNVLSGMRLMHDAMDQRRPVESALTQAGVGTVSALPLAAYALPSRLEGFTPAQAIIRGGIGGATAGAGEGVVSGFLAGRGGFDDRLRSAKERAVFGGVLGGVLGGAAPAISGGAARLSATPAVRRFAAMAKEKGIAPETLGLLGRRIAAEEGVDVATPTRAASLAETSQRFVPALDVGLLTEAPGSVFARQLLISQADEAAGNVVSIMDDVLGEPAGRSALIKDIMQSSAPERARLYADAYSQPVPYSDELREMLRRVPDDVISRANELMQVEGVPGRQIRMVTDALGNPQIERLPNMQQLDYITRALQDRGFSEQAAPAAQRAYRGLTQEMREELDRLIPEYAAARSAAAETIGDREAVQAGYEIFRRQMPVEEVQEILSEFTTDGQRLNVRAGLRQYIEDRMGQALEPLSQRASDADIASRSEGLRALRDLIGTPAARQKLVLVLGDDAAEDLISRLRGEIPAFQMAQLGYNSKTEPRGDVRVGERSANEQGPITDIRQGEVTRAIARLPGRVLGYGAESAEEVTRRAFGEAAPIIARQRTPESLEALRQYITEAQRLSEIPLQRTQGAMAATLPFGIAAAPTVGREYQRQFGGGR